jgi:hypothetical protein
VPIAPSITLYRVRKRLTKRAGVARRNIFKAMSIIACCRLACASLITDHDPEVGVEALQAAYDLLGDAADEMEAIHDEHGDGADPSEDAS